MSADLELVKGLLERALIEKNQETLIHDILTPLSTHLSGYLSNSKDSSLQKLGLILTIFPILIRFIETSSLLRDLLFRVGCQVNITIICREIAFYAGSFPELIDQSAYAAALLKFTSSGFPPLLADLPIFLRANLLDKYETLKEKASKAAAAAEEAKLELGRAAFRAVFAECWAEVQAEHLPALEEGMRLRREWWNEPVSSKKTLTKEQLKHLKSYDDFTSFVRKKMNGN
jgi:hypothetical protein